MAFADSAVRTVISPVRLWGSRARGVGGGLVAPELGSLSNSGTRFVKGKKCQSLGVKKSLTSVLILHAHLHTEVSWKFSVFFQKSPRPIKITPIQQSVYSLLGVTEQASCAGTGERTALRLGLKRRPNRLTAIGQHVGVAKLTVFSFLLTNLRLLDDNVSHPPRQQRD